jgi:hypothetical protein
VALNVTDAERSAARVLFVGWQFADPPPDVACTTTVKPRPSMIVSSGRHWVCPLANEVDGPTVVPSTARTVMVAIKLEPVCRWTQAAL